MLRLEAEVVHQMCFPVVPVEGTSYQVGGGPKRAGPVLGMQVKVRKQVITSTYKPIFRSPHDRRDTRELLPFVAPYGLGHRVVAVQGGAVDRTVQYNL